MPKIFLPQKNLKLQADPGQNLMRFLQSQGIPVASSCGGDAICGKCCLKITDPLPPPSALESATLAKNHPTTLPAIQRLSCQILVEETDLTVEATYW